MVHGIEGVGVTRQFWISAAYIAVGLLALYYSVFVPWLKGWQNTVAIVAAVLLVLMHMRLVLRDRRRKTP